MREREERKPDISYLRSIEDGGDGLTVALQNEIPVDQAVPIGTKLQLRATINNESGRKNKIIVWIN